MKSEDRKKVKLGVKLRRTVPHQGLDTGKIYTVNYYDPSNGKVGLEDTPHRWDIANFELVEDPDLNPLDFI